MRDISYSTDDYIFSYRAAGILIHDGKVLLQKPGNGDGYAFPGGQVAFGETNSETLIREFGEEIGVDIDVVELKWVQENLVPWANKPAHQICLYHLVRLKDTESIPKRGRFASKEYHENIDDILYFYWIPIDEVKNITVYPSNAHELLHCIDDGVKHFVCLSE